MIRVQRIIVEITFEHHSSPSSRARPRELNLYPQSIRARVVRLRRRLHDFFDKLTELPFRSTLTVDQVRAIRLLGVQKLVGVQSQNLKRPLSPQRALPARNRLLRVILNVPPLSLRHRRPQHLLDVVREIKLPRARVVRLIDEHLHPRHVVSLFAVLDVDRNPRARLRASSGASSRRARAHSRRHRRAAGRERLRALREHRRRRRRRRLPSPRARRGGVGCRRFAQGAIACGQTVR